MSHRNYSGESHHFFRGHRGGGRYFDRPATSECGRRDSDERRGYSGLGDGSYRNQNEMHDDFGEWWHRNPRGEYRGLGRRNHNKRRLNSMAKQYDETGVARKRVKGGRIAKVRKVRDPEPDLYCEVCEYYLADANAKAAHDRGKLHLKKIEEKREQLDQEQLEGEAEDDSRDNEGNRLEIVEHGNASGLTGDRIFELYKRAFHDKTKPVAYTKWCKRSLESCLGAKTMSLKEQKALRRQVQREIVEFTAHKYDEGTWLLQNWDSLPLATGKRYIKNQPPKPYGEVVVPSNLVKKMYDAAPAFANVTVLPMSEEEEKDAVMKVDTSNKPDDSVPVDDDPMDAGIVEKPPLLQVNISWRMTSAAAAMLIVNQTNHPNSIVSRFADVYPRDIVAKKLEEEAEERCSQEVLVNEFKHLREQFEKEVYDCSLTFDKEVNALIEKFERTGDNTRYIQECCEMLVGNAIISFHFALLARPLSRLMEYYKLRSHLNQKQKEYIGYWVMSLLMRAGKTCSKEPNISLQCKLSKLPARLIKLQCVRLGLGVLRSLVTNNHSAFFDLYSNSPVHLDTNRRSAYVMESFIPIVRQRALLTWGSPSPFEGNILAFAHPNVVPVQLILERLKWNMEGANDGEEEWNVEEAKEQMLALGLSVVPEADGQSENLVASQCAPVVKPISYLDCATIFGFLSANTLVRLK